MVWDSGLFWDADKAMFGAFEDGVDGSGGNLFFFCDDEDEVFWGASDVGAERLEFFFEAVFVQVFVCVDHAFGAVADGVFSELFAERFSWTGVSFEEACEFRQLERKDLAAFV